MNDTEELNQRERLIKKSFIDPARQNAHLSFEAYQAWLLPLLEPCYNLSSEYELIKREYDKILSTEYAHNYPFKNIAKADKKLCQDIDLTYLWSLTIPTQLSSYSDSLDGYTLRSELTKAMLIYQKLTFLKSLLNEPKFQQFNNPTILQLSKTQKLRKSKTVKEEKNQNNLTWKDIFINSAHVDYILDLLTKQDFVCRHSPDKFVWIRQEGTSQRTIVALCLTLNKKGYIDFRNKAKAAVATMNQLHVQIKETEFQGSKAETYYEKYKDLFYFIPDVKKADI